MDREFKCKLTQKQLDELNKLYEEAKAKLGSSIGSFDEFVQTTIASAIDTHIQFVSMNEKMMDMFDSTLNSMNNTNFDLNNIDEFINNIFNKNTNENKTKKESTKAIDKTTKIKN